MKIAILFDFIEGCAGGEKLLKFLAQKYDADIYTGYVDWDNTYPEFKNMRITVIGKISKIQILKQEMLIRSFRKLDLSGYDKIICLGLYSIYAAENFSLKKSSQKKSEIIWYPYGVSPFYKKRANMDDSFANQSLIWKIGAWILTQRTKGYNKKIVQNNIDRIVTISTYSRKSFREYYGRDSAVISPPVDMDKHYWKQNKGYYLIVSRLLAGKRVDLVIEAFKKMPDKILYIEGIGHMENKLKELANGYDNIKFLGRIQSDKLPELYSECIAFVGTALYDDWSMPMVEALASGKPCIAVNKGAYPEIINDRVGILVEGTPEGIIAGVNKITPGIAESMKDECIKRARRWGMVEFGNKWDKICEVY